MLQKSWGVDAVSYLFLKVWEPKRNLSLEKEVQNDRMKNLMNILLAVIIDS